MGGETFMQELRIEDDHRSFLRRAEIVVIAITMTLDKIGGWIILPAIFSVVIVDVVLRYVFNSPLVWSLEFNRWMLFLMFVAGIPECTRQNGHIRMELLAVNLSARMQVLLDAVYTICAAAVFFLLAQSAYKSLMLSLKFNRVTEYLSLPVAVTYAVTLAVCVIMIVYYALRLIAGVLGAREFPRAPISHIEK